MTKPTGRPVGRPPGPTKIPKVSNTLMLVRRQTLDLMKIIAHYEGMDMIDALQMIVAKKAEEYYDE